MGLGHVLASAVGLAAGIVIALLVFRQHFRTVLERRRAENDLSLARRQEEALAEARSKASEEQEQERKEFAARCERREQELTRRERKLTSAEDKLASREEALDQREQVLAKKLSACDRREARFLQREEAIDAREAELEERIGTQEDREREIGERLAEVAGLSPDEAREQLFARLDQTLTTEQGEIIARRQKETEAQAKEIACEIVSRAIQRYAAEHTAETTTAVVKLADDDLKGRIIGKEGRNIRAFEQATGVDLIIDDTPNQITLSCFDGVRREIARRALEELLADGRIQPARIEEVLIKTRQDMDRAVLKLGEDSAFECDVSGLHPQLLKMLGKLHYRTSYGQNVLRHSIEAAHLAGAMASDLGLNPKLARRCALLHDVGKAIDHEHEGSHPELGAEALRRFNENKRVVNAAYAHHEGKESLGIYTTLVAAADAISAARPGARRENVERYLKRLAQLEDIALSYKGVMKAYAIQAGREVRVFVNGNTLDDRAMPKVARDIAHRIEDQVAYPGEVKITLIRETRSTSIAR